MKTISMDGCIKILLYIADTIIGGTGFLLIQYAMGLGSIPANHSGAVLFVIAGICLTVVALIAGIVLAVIPSDD